eukprot:TRINITY_DN5867_c0_g1_i1.p1 TRINITY_DN5867_c0_g1~~TRINITY_DN5867_c0_g1_i1.p1  ORF type:complete len:501 (+),score=348.26 TRINITY_DN5867_c0_g1_i1:102-1505(+)
MTDILSDTYTDDNKQSWLFDNPPEPLPLGTSDDLFSGELSSTDLSVGLSLDLPPTAAALDSAVFATPATLNAPPPPPLLMTLSAMNTQLGALSGQTAPHVKREAADDAPPPLPTTPPSGATTASGATADEGDDEFTPRKRRVVRPTRRALAARDASSDGSSDDGKESVSDSDTSPPKRRGRRAAAEIIKERMDPALLNGPPPNCDPAIRRVALTRERLLTIGSAEMEARCDELQSALALTPAEQKELRRQRRLVKNREYAQQSRNKKKRVLQSVDTTITDLQRENDELQRELAATQGRLAAALRAASALGDAGRELVSTLLGGASAAAAVSGKRRRTDSADAADADASSTGSSSSSAGGVALFVMLLSFGVSLAAFGGHAATDARAAPPLVARGTHTRAPGAPAMAVTPSKTNRALLTCDDAMWTSADVDVDETRANGTELVDALVGRLAELELDDTHSLPPLVESV